MSSTPSDASNAVARRAPFTVVALSFMVYIHSLRNGFVNYDDLDERILKNPFLNTPWDWSFIPQAFTQATAGYYDPIYVLSYVIDYQVWGMNPAGFHFGNLVLHTLNALLVFYLTARMTRRTDLAWVTALLFAVHPIHVESVAWATSRKDTLSLFFALASLRVYWQGVGRETRRYAWHAAAALVLLLLGMMTKPTVGVVPGLILFAELLLGPRPFAWRRIVTFQVVAWTLLLVFVAATFAMTVGLAVKGTIQFTPTQHVILFFELYAYYIKLALWPLNLSALYVIEIRDRFEPWILAMLIPGLSLLVGWMFVELKRSVADAERARRHGPVLWGAVVFFAGLLPFTNIMPRTIYLADRYLYLASIGFCLILASLLLRIRRPRLRLAGIIIMIALYGVLTIERVPVWRDSVTLWSDVVRKTDMDPDRKHLLMARAYGFEGRWEEALREYERMDLAARRDPQLWMTVANAYFTVGQRERAREIFERLMTACPQYLVPVMQGIALDIEQNRLDEARQRAQRFNNRFTVAERQWLQDVFRLQAVGRTEQVWQVFQRLSESIEQRTAPIKAELIRQCSDRL
ncbi:tetratricopeptide repeat protein [Nitrospina watsonii]|uniref:Enzyme n=1 Tax=Nitrospina watsonii TaxID=1323948 RepID=A0ABN8W5Q9_9BACT|nr:tetratricopeptide repeat protein [Nitrospina watsonii]CAI2719530.1 putative enzyme [Nitrospina watsonii]